VSAERTSCAFRAPKQVDCQPEVQRRTVGSAAANVTSDCWEDLRCAFNSCRGVGCLHTEHGSKIPPPQRRCTQICAGFAASCSRRISLQSFWILRGAANLNIFGVRCWHRSLARSAEMTEPDSVLVFCVRHGETSWNEAGLLQGQTDIPLNDRGRQQARQAGVFLAQRHQLDRFAGYVSSDLSRAFETASLIMAALPIGGRPQTDKRLRETHMGRWQGKTWEDVTTDPDDRVASDKWRRDPDYPVPGEGGESFRVRFSRVAAATHAAALQAAAVATGALADKSASGVTASAESSTSLHVASTPPASSARVLLVSHGGVLDDVARLVKKVCAPVASDCSLLSVPSSVISVCGMERRLPFSRFSFYLRRTRA